MGNEPIDEWNEGDRHWSEPLNRELADAVVRFVSNPAPEVADGLNRFSQRKWRSSMHWLITSGLALYLLDGLKRVSHQDVLPSATRNTLEEMWSASELRVRSLETTLVDINQRFAATAFPYANWKGFATVPDFCPDARFRAFQDFDFVVNEQNLPAFGALLAGLGFTQVEGSDSELRYENLPGRHTPFEKTYHDDECRKVELHTRMNGTVGTRSFATDAGLLERRVVSVRNGISFPTLAPADAFFLHAVHACRHLLDGWTRPAWLLEIRHFIDVHRDDRMLWRDVRSRAEAMAAGAILVGVAVWLAKSLFHFETPGGLAWAVESLDRRVMAWLQRFGRAAALAEFPGTKLPLLLVRELMDENSWSEFEAGRLAPVKRPKRVSRAQDSSIRQRLIAARWQMKFVWSRVRFHTREGARYAIEKRRWDRDLGALPAQQTSLIS